jgi:UDP-glucose 4-epimerase
MKILVTGGAGFIGSHVVDLYLEHGHEVVVVDDLSTGHRANVHPKAKFYPFDIRRPELDEVFAAERPQVVNHHAAQMSVRVSVDRPLFDADVNVLGSLNVLECSRRHGVERVIYISSGGAVYGEPVYLPCDEEHPVDPICPYGVTKHVVEHYLHLYRVNYGLRYLVLRYPNVYGPRQDPAGEAGVVAIFTGQMLAGKPVTINGDGTQERDFVFVGDCARANLAGLDPAAPTGIFNLGSGGGTSILEIFRQLQQITAYGAPPHFAPAKLGETYRIFLTAAKARRDLAWEPTVDLATGLQQTVEYFRRAIATEAA